MLRVAETIMAKKNFLKEFLEKTDFSPEDLARLMEQRAPSRSRGSRAIYNWLKSGRPSGRGVSLLADVLDIPINVLRDAINGRAELDHRYFDRKRYTLATSEPSLRWEANGIGLSEALRSARMMIEYAERLLHSPPTDRQQLSEPEINIKERRKAEKV